MRVEEHVFLLSKIKIFLNFYISFFFSIIVIFSVSFPMVNTYKIYNKEVLIQPPGEPREQHLGDIRPKQF